VSGGPAERHGRAARAAPAGGPTSIAATLIVGLGRAAPRGVWRDSWPTSVAGNSRAAVICAHVPSLDQRSYRLVSYSGSDDDRSGIWITRLPSGPPRAPPAATFSRPASPARPSRRRPRATPTP